MTDESSPAEFVGRGPDERLLSGDLDEPPRGRRSARGRSSPSRARGRIVGTGATLTAASLVLGSLLVLLGLIDAVSSGFDGLSIAILVVGAILVITHWGWVHVAELTANSIEGRGNAEIEDRRRQWLATIQPYTPLRDLYARRGRRLDHDLPRRVTAPSRAASADSRSTARPNTKRSTRPTSPPPRSPSGPSCCAAKRRRTPSASASATRSRPTLTRRCCSTTPTSSNGASPARRVGGTVQPDQLEPPRSAAPRVAPRDERHH